MSAREGLEMRLRQLRTVPKEVLGWAKPEMPAPAPPNGAGFALKPPDPATSTEKDGAGLRGEPGEEVRVVDDVRRTG